MCEPCRRRFPSTGRRGRVAHGPEVVGAGDAQDLLVGKARHLLPEIKGLVVVDVDGDQQLIDGQPEFLGDQVPGQLDGPFLEVIAEREVPSISKKV